MLSTVIRNKQDLTYLKWSHIRSSSGTAGTFLKSESTIGDKKVYYKLSYFDVATGEFGHECVNEVIVDRLLTLLNVDHLSYELIYADIEFEGRTYTTYLCASQDFKKRGESKIALDDFYRNNALPGESHYDFCVRNGWRRYIDTMLVVDYLILNRDRHGANIEILRDSRNHSLRIAPLFDHGLSLMYSCNSQKELEAYDIMEDKRCQNFIGSYSCLKNLELVNNMDDLFPYRLSSKDFDPLFEGLHGVIPESHIKKIWDMIYNRFTDLHLGE